MDINDEMLKVAITKSVEAGLLPRRALKEDFYDAKEMMRTILKCALEKATFTENFDICVDSSALEPSSDFENKSQVLHT